jgi:hypothetical protein
MWRKAMYDDVLIYEDNGGISTKYVDRLDIRISELEAEVKMLRDQLDDGMPTAVE